MKYQNLFSMKKKKKAKKKAKYFKMWSKIYTACLSVKQRSMLTFEFFYLSSALSDCPDGDTGPASPSSTFVMQINK